MSSARSWDSSVSQDVPSTAGSELRGTVSRKGRGKRATRVSSIVAQEVSVGLLRMGQGGEREVKPGGFVTVEGRAKCTFLVTLCDA